MTSEEIYDEIDNLKEDIDDDLASWGWAMNDCLSKEHMKNRMKAYIKRFKKICGEIK
jgi:hypothetical protein